MNELDDSLISKLKYISNIISIILILLGFIFFLGWVFDIIIFKTPGSGLPSISSNASLCFIFLGLSLWFLQEKRFNKRNLLIGRFFAFLAVLIGFLTLTEYLFELNLGIDSILLNEPVNAMGNIYSNRMSFSSSINFILAGIALLSLKWSKNKENLITYSSITVVALLNLLFIIGYIYQSTVYDIYRVLIASPYTVIEFLLVFFGVLFTYPDKGLMKIITSNYLGSQLARRILPAIIIIPLVVGWLRLLGEERGLYDSAFGTAMVIFISIILLVLVAINGAMSVNRGDIKRKKAEEKLEIASRYNRSLIEASIDPFVTISPNGVINDVNKSTELITGYSRDEIIGTDFSNYFAESEKAKEAYKRVFMDGKVIDYHLEIKHKDGHKTPVLYNASVYEDEQGDITGIFAAARDITELKRAEKNLKNVIGELERSNEELEKFAYVASHDLQEPLRMIVSYLQLFERKYKDKLDEKGSKYMYYAVDGAMRMQTLINDLLTYSRVETRRKEFKPVNCEEVLNQTLLNLDFSIKKNKAIITHDPLPTVLADGGQLVQLFQNLIGNAIKFKKPDEQPKVHISAKEESDKYIFSVKDNGIGIEPQYKDRIFEVFQRLQKRSEYEGTGIGLAISKKIVERHGGHIWVESEPGRGSTFYFTLAKH